MEIYLVVPGKRDYENRYTDFVFDEFDNPGYFTSHEAAKAWVDEQQSVGNAAYQAALKTYPARLEAFKAKQKANRIKEDEIVERAKAANVPYTRKHIYAEEPRKPMLGEYVKTEYEIWEVSPH